jgi:hypothetical protein
MTKSAANAILQSRTRRLPAFEARLLADAEYIAVRARIAELKAGERTDAQQAELVALLDRKYEIADRVGTA